MTFIQEPVNDENDNAHAPTRIKRMARKFAHHEAMPSNQEVPVTQAAQIEMAPNTDIEGETIGDILLGDESEVDEDQDDGKVSLSMPQFIYC